MVQNSFDAGIFLTLLSVGFVLLLSFKKIGGIALIGSILAFLVIGLLVITGYDISSTIITTSPNISPINQTSYFIGNGAAPTGIGQLILGWLFIILAVISGVLFLDSMSKGQFFPAS